jgi:hypothetical protein
MTIEERLNGDKKCSRKERKFTLFLYVGGIMKLLLIANFFYAVIALTLWGCGDKFEECVHRQQEEYRIKHPEASYSEVSRLRSSFEASCPKNEK